MAELWKGGCKRQMDGFSMQMSWLGLTMTYHTHTEQQACQRNYRQYPYVPVSRDKYSVSLRMLCRFFLRQCSVPVIDRGKRCRFSVSKLRYILILCSFSA